ncbi:MAG: Hpt domain-containing protein [Lachnospiraceae bacterium]|nr:Hpt domain-containing protein [Lachnospiraceae bacterium]
MGNAAETMGKLDFLDTETAMVYFANMKELYVETVAVYLRDRFDAALQKDFDTEDWATYQRDAHSIKSSSNMIGAKDMFEKAKSLELAVKSGDYAFVKENHDNIMKDYKELLDKIQNALQ